ncbi:tape measure protein [Vibrio natriegens]|uniref:tape measure protein n=2 Tax=Vibrio harveyi group TaxID=717610 RepID=UPI0021E743F6|nr:tape measure protein [Vibrio natriegens]UYI49650.1 tape measure protein [Vibrio natriegens]
MARKLHKFVNEIGWRLDRQSWNSVLKQSKQLVKQLERANPQTILNPDVGGTASNRRRRQPDQDAHAKAYRKRNEEQKRFEQIQKRVLKRFVLSNQAVRDLDISEKKVLLTKLKQASTSQELLHLERKLKTQVTDRNRKEKARTRELQRQQGISKNLAANLAGAYAGVMSGHAVVQTGLTFESLERSMLVTSGSAEKAADNFAFVREQANRLGLDINTLTGAYVKFQAAAGNKMSEGDLRGLFTGLAEYNTALGVTAEAQQRSLIAVQQIASKGVLYSEEVYGQLAESSVGGVKNLINAAVALGKIDKNLSEVDKERAFRKLMKDGKLIASEILPEFGRQLSIAANRNDQLAWSLKTGLGPQLSIAKNNVLELGNEFFKGLKPAIMAITKSFNLLAGESKGLAGVLGTGLGSAIKAVTFPFMMLGAVIVDTYTYLRDLFNLTDEGITKFAKFAATAIGLTYGITRLIQGFKLLWNIGSKVGSLFGKGAGTVTTMSKGVSGLNAGLRGTVGLFGRLFPLVTGLLTVWDARQGGSMSATSLFGENSVTKWLDKPISEHLRNTTNTIKNNQQKVDVNLNIVSDVNHNGNIVNTIRSEIDNDRENQMINFYQNLSPSSN